MSAPFTVAVPGRARRQVAVFVLAAVSIGVILPGSTGCAAKRRKTQAAPPPERVYQTALAKMQKKRYYTARTLLQGLLPRVPPDDRELLPKIQMGIADSFFKERGQLNYGEALNSYRTFLTYYPNHEEADRAQFMVGMSLFQQALSPDRDQSLTYQAINEFRKVETVYSTSSYIEQARRKIIECHDRLAEHERLVGRFYQKRRKYNAAIDRYRTILDQYPHYRETNQVLFDLGKCLLLVGNRPEGEEFFSRLFQDQPDGKLASRARELLAEHDRAREIESRKGRKE